MNRFWLKKTESVRTNLQKKKQMRSLPPFSPCGITDLSTNSYLALEREPILHSTCKNAIVRFSGNLASRLVRTASPLFDQLEADLAHWKHCEDALIFNSGYAANIGVLQALGGKDIEVFSDRLNHASIVDGIVLSRSKLTRFAHKNYDDLENRLKKSCKPGKIIITDSLFSMDGDRADLHAVADLAHTYGALTIIDEAHATAVYGETGRGIAAEQGVSERIDIHVGTFSKALAGLGGFVCCSAAIKQFLVNTARSLIFSTALPESVLRWNSAALAFIQDHPQHAADLHKNAAFLRTALQKQGYNIGGSTTHIIPLITGSNESAQALSRHLQHNNFIVPAIRPPTVPQNQARIRISLHSAVTHKQLQGLIHSTGAFFQ
jgi:8-amino-7-oxononanoate synthase